MEECPKCGSDNAYCDGVENVCPDCGYTWPSHAVRRSDWDYDDDDDDDDDDIEVEVRVIPRSR